MMKIKLIAPREQHDRLEKGEGVKLWNWCNELGQISQKGGGLL